MRHPACQSQMGKNNRDGAADDKGRVLKVVIERYQDDHSDHKKESISE